MKAKGVVLWLTGLSGSGKTTIARMVEKELRARDCLVEVLDGDVVRNHLSQGLGYSKEDRDTNVCRIGFVANLLSRNGVVVIVAAISPYRDIRNEIRRSTTNFVEVYVKASLPVCEQRDVKGLYAKARTGNIKNFTGINDPYEEPLSPEIICYTDSESIEESTGKVVNAVEQLGYIPAKRLLNRVADIVIKSY